MLNFTFMIRNKMTGEVRVVRAQAAREQDAREEVLESRDEQIISSRCTGGESMSDVARREGATPIGFLEDASYDARCEAQRYFPGE